MPRSRRTRLIAAVIILCGFVVLPGLAACSQDRPATVIGLAESEAAQESAPAQEDEGPAEPQPEDEVVEAEPFGSAEPWPEGDVPAAEPVESPSGSGAPAVEVPVEAPVESPSATGEPFVEDLVDEPQSQADEPVEEPVVDEPADEPVADKPVDEPVEGDHQEDLLTLLLEGDLDEEQQEELLRALEDEAAWEDPAADESALDDPAADEPMADGPVRDAPGAADGPVTAAESLQVESTPIGPMATVNVFTDTQPVGPRLSVSVGLREGAPATGAPVVVIGQGLAPGSEVTVTVYSTPHQIAVGSVDERGAVALGAVLPDGLDPGGHTVDVRATGADGAAVQSIGSFTIDADSLVEDVAPMGELLDPIGPNDPMLERAMRAGAPVYDPARYPTVTVAAGIMAVAVVGLVGVSRLSSLSLPGAPTGGGRTPAPAGSGARGPARLSKMNTRSMKSAGEGGRGWGDRRGSWRWPGTAFLDRTVQQVALRLGRYTELGPRVLDDGTWARAMLGSASLMTWILGAVLGLIAARSVGFGAFPPAAPLILALVVVGILDATAGAIAWAVLAVGVVVTGQLGSWDDLRTMLGLFALYVAIPLAANALRPLRRAPATTAKERFDRLADYVAMPVLIAWAGTAMLLALNGLSGLQLVEDELIGPMRWAIAVALLVRLALEDLAAHGFPARVAAVRPSARPDRSMPVQLASVALRVGVFVLVIVPFTGMGAITLVAAAMTAVPMLLRVFQDRLVNVSWLYRYFPRGMASRLLTMVVAIYLAAWLLGQAATSDHTPETYTWLLLPGIIVGVVSAFGREGRHWPDSWFKRSAGSLVWIVLAGLTVGALTVPLL